MKALNRKIYLALDDRRKDIEAKRDIVDKLQLQYENLLYKQSYLQREIQTCKDLDTPNLVAIEKELARPLASAVFSENLEAVTVNTMETLKAEQEARVEAKKHLESLKETRDQAIKECDKKRKFMDDLPSKLIKIQLSTMELQTQFQDILN